MATAAADDASPPRKRLLKLPSLGEDPNVNPFSDPRPPITAFRVLFFVLMLPLFIARVLMLFVILIICYISVKLALIGVTDALFKPFPQWRRSLLWPLRIGVRAVMFFVFGYYWIPVKGKCAPRDVSPVIVCNHISFVEPLFIFSAHLPVILSAKENAELPLVGAFLEALQIIPVDRTSPESRHSAAGQIKRRAIDNAWPHVAIFPEGTTTNGKVLVCFKTGAFSPGLPVQPMVVRYSNINPAWVNSGPYIALLYLMTQPINFMKVEYLDVCVPTSHEMAHPHSFADRVRRNMAQALGVQVTEHTFLDAKLAIEAVKLHQPADLTLAEFGIMERLFHLDYGTAKACLQKFSSMDVTHSGYLRIDEFLNALNLPLTPSTREVFQLFDTGDRGYINFREFVAGMAFLSSQTTFSSVVEAAFRACDRDHDGSLSQSEVERSLKNIFPEIKADVIKKLFDALDLDQNGIISWEEFQSFLQRNPEYLAVIMVARPEFLGARL
ncbi:hypothetical protein KP509_39G045200 [Ceratopteris richardii]|uniref:EF-hand domain-containing protein n=1 Tax=Ceratopteris richardii TaxID=49495 RepID=A0A8T2Q072_CERRI|nr:hypothetical protein KP509_39G045200 [Ceratopteris richardii]